MNRILIIQTAFLGDVILATPVISELKRIFPHSSIDFLVRKGNESLLDNNPALNETFVFDKSNGKLKSMYHLIRTFRSNKYDLVINLHRFGSSGIITGLSGARKKFGFRKNPFSFLYTQRFEHNIENGTHEVERNLSLIKSFGAITKRRPELYPSDKNYDTISNLNKDAYYCFAPASVWFTKQLPKENWIKLIQHLSSSGKIYLLGGKGDFELCKEILEESNIENGINLAGKLSLMESAALMKTAVRNYVNDSGPLHIASAMNASVTAFFCSTVPTFGFGPLSDDSKVKEINAPLYCRPCGLHGYKACPQGHFRCGKEIDVIN